jgi:hypothetical protein
MQDAKIARFLWGAQAASLLHSAALPNVLSP